MRLKINYTESGSHLDLDTEENETVGEIKQKVEEYFKIDTSGTGREKKRIVLEFAGGDLNDSWIMNDLPIPAGSVVKCLVRVERDPDFRFYLTYKQEYFSLYDTELNISRASVLELRVCAANHLGLPLSIFRLKKPKSEQILFDDKTLFEYGIVLTTDLILETWQGWDTFLHYAMSGFHNQLMKSLSTDEYIKQYQMRCALYIAAHYGCVDLAANLILQGVRADQPVGEHPCRQWCKIDYSKLKSTNSKQDSLKLEYLRCPIHEAVLSGQLKVVYVISKLCVHMLEKKDGFDLPPWRLALRNNHKDPVKNSMQKEVARFLLSRQFGGKVKLLSRNVSIHLYARIKYWCDRAKERVLAKYGLAKSSIKKRPFFQEGLAGNTVLIDGFNNNFKDQLNSFERLRGRYKYYYFIDQEDKEKRGLPELYFRTVGLVNARSNNNPAAATSKQSKPIVTYPADRPPPKTLALWKKAVNTIIFRKVIKRHYDLLVELGVEVDMDDWESMNDTDEEEEESKNKENRRQKSDLRSAKSGNRTTKLPRILSRYNKSSRLPSSLKKDEKKKPQSSSSEDQRAREAYRNSLAFFEENYLKARKNRHQSVVFAIPDDYRYETMTMFKKYRQGVSSLDNATKIMNEVSSFKSKSWMQQIYLGTRMARENAKRSIRKYSVEN